MSRINVAISKSQYVDYMSVARSIGLKVTLRELEQGDELESLAFLTLKGSAHQLGILDKIFE
jgi:hypothetical protein